MSNIGIIGCGIISEYLISGVKRSGGNLVAVCDMNKELAEKIAKDWNANVYTDVDEFLKDENMEAVILALPSDMHYDFACKILKAGKHLFCEKPMTTDVEDSHKLAKLANETDLVFQMGYMKRFHPAYAQIKELLKKIGPVYSGRVQLSLHAPGWHPVDHLDASSWHFDRKRSGGGTLTHGGSHLIDLIQHLFGTPTHAFGKVLIDGSGDEYNTNITFKTDNETPVLLDIRLVAIENGSPADTDWDEFVEIIGQKGRLRAENYNWVGTLPCKLYLETTDGGKEEFEYDTSLQWADEFAAFQKAIAGEKTEASSAIDGYNVDVILKQIREIGEELKLIKFEY